MYRLEVNVFRDLIILFVPTKTNEKNGTTGPKNELNKDEKDIANDKKKKCCFYLFQ